MTPHLKVTINGEVVMDGSVGQWQERQPEFVMQALAGMTNGATAPYMRSLLLVIAEAVQTQTYTEVEIKHNGSGWSLNVRYAIELEA